MSLDGRWNIFEEILQALGAAQVRYVVVGGVAVVLHGHMRLTADLDLVVALDTPNVRRAIDALTKLGLRPTLPVPAEAFADPATREKWRNQRGLRVFSLHDPEDPLKQVDLFAEEPLPFDELEERAASVTIGSLTVPVASVGDLIQMKRDAGRPQDLLDIEALEALEDEL